MSVCQSVSRGIMSTWDGYTAVDTGWPSRAKRAQFLALSPRVFLFLLLLFVGGRLCAYYYHDFDWPLLGKHASQDHRGNVPGHQPEREVQAAVPADIEGQGEECQQAEVVRYPPADPKDRVEHGGLLGRVVFVDVVVERVDLKG